MPRAFAGPGTPNCHRKAWVEFLRVATTRRRTTTTESVAVSVPIDFGGRSGALACIKDRQGQPQGPAQQVVRERIVRCGVVHMVRGAPEIHASRQERRRPVRRQRLRVMADVLHLSLVGRLLNLRAISKQNSAHPFADRRGDPTRRQRNCGAAPDALASCCRAKLVQRRCHRSHHPGLTSGGGTEASAVCKTRSLSGLSDGFRVRPMPQKRSPVGLPEGPPMQQGASRPPAAMTPQARQCPERRRRSSKWNPNVCGQFLRARYVGGHRCQDWRAI